ncbi:unnamed protein product [Lathyrus sativus]|nr:unnamed protein product [Lathyrus sativus]
MSHIDRFLLSDALIDHWNIVGQSIGKRELSDHFPIWITINADNWGPKPFRFMDCWLDHNGFACFVENEWNSFAISRRSGFVIIQNA